MFGRRTLTFGRRKFVFSLPPKVQPSASESEGQRRKSRTFGRQTFNLRPPKVCSKSASEAKSSASEREEQRRKSPKFGRRTLTLGRRKFFFKGIVSSPQMVRPPNSKLRPPNLSFSGHGITVISEHKRLYLHLMHPQRPYL